MSSRLTVSGDAGSTTSKTDLTAIGARASENCDTTLEFKEVIAILVSLFVSFNSSGMDIPFSISQAFEEAFWKASDIVVG